MPKLIFKPPGESVVKKSFEIYHIKVTIGRSSSCNITLTHPSVSSKHCTLKRVKGGHTLVDDDSTNGIKYDDKRFDLIDLKEKRQYYIGEVPFEIIYTKEEWAKISKEERRPSKQKAKLPPISDN